MLNQKCRLQTQVQTTPTTLALIPGGLHLARVFTWCAAQLFAWRPTRLLMPNALVPLTHTHIVLCSVVTFTSVLILTYSRGGSPLINYFINKSYDYLVKTPISLDGLYFILKLELKLFSTFPLIGEHNSPKQH